MSNTLTTVHIGFTSLERNSMSNTLTTVHIGFTSLERNSMSNTLTTVYIGFTSLERNSMSNTLTTVYIRKREKKNWSAVSSLLQIPLTLSPSLVKIGLGQNKIP
jgi:hypothetical protein